MRSLALHYISATVRCKPDAGAGAIAALAGARQSLSPGYAAEIHASQTAKGKIQQAMLTPRQRNSVPGMHLPQRAGRQ